MFQSESTNYLLPETALDPGLIDIAVVIYVLRRRYVYAQYIELGFNATA